jgi:hypothetical protein
MFHSIPHAVYERMQYLQQIDSRDRNDGTPHAKRLRQISPDTPRAKIVTFEIVEEKARIARETFKLAKIEDRVELIVGDVTQLLFSL